MCPLNGELPDADAESRNDDKRRRLESTTSHRTSPRAGKKSTIKPVFRQLASVDQDVGNDDIWADQSFFAVELPPVDLDASFDFGVLDDYFGPERLREDWEQDIATLSRTSTNDIQPEIVTNVLFPDVPDVSHRQLDLNLLNPFTEGSVGRYDKHRAIVATTKEGEVNGYIKFRLQQTQAGFDEPTGTFGRNVFGKRHRQCPATMWKTPGAVLPLLPPNFGRGLKLDTNDQKLLTFCTLSPERV